MNGLRKLLAASLSALLLLALLPTTASAAVGFTFSIEGIQRSGLATASLDWVAADGASGDVVKYLVKGAGEPKPAKAADLTNSITVGTDASGTASLSGLDSLESDSDGKDLVLYYLLNNTGDEGTEVEGPVAIKNFLNASITTSSTVPAANRTKNSVTLEYESDAAGGTLYYVVHADGSVLADADAIVNHASVKTVSLSATAGDSFVVTTGLDATDDNDISYTIADGDKDNPNTFFSAKATLTVGAYTQAVSAAVDSPTTRTQTSENLVVTSNAAGTLYYVAAKAGGAKQPANAAAVRENGTSVAIAVGANDVLVKDLTDEDNVYWTFVEEGVAPTVMANVALTAFSYNGNVTAPADRTVDTATVTWISNGVATLYWKVAKTAAPPTATALRALTGANKVTLFDTDADGPETLALTGLTSDESIYYVIDPLGGAQGSLSNHAIPNYALSVTVTPDPIVRGTRTTADVEWESNGPATLYWLVAEDGSDAEPADEEELVANTNVKKVALSATTGTIRLTGLTADDDTFYYAVEEGTGDTATLGSLADITISAFSGYTVTIMDGGNGSTGNGEYAASYEVTVNAGTRSGFTFAGWEETNGSIGATAEKLAEAELTFTMPSNAVVLTATWEEGSGNSGNTGGGWGSSGSNGSWPGDNYPPAPPPPAEVLPGTPGTGSSTPTTPSVTNPFSFRVLARSLNVRSGPGTSFVKVGTLRANDVVSIVGYSADGLWAQTQTGSWVSLAYVSQVVSVDVGDYIVTVKSGSLNVRSGPGTSSAKIGSLANNALVMVHSVTNGWAQIEYNGSVGYVSVLYLR